MQFTESEIQEILQENEMLKKDLIEAREELEATNKLYDTMVMGTRNLLLLVEEGCERVILHGLLHNPQVTPDLHC